MKSQKESGRTGVKSVETKEYIGVIEDNRQRTHFQTGMATDCERTSTDANIR